MGYVLKKHNKQSKHLKTFLPMNTPIVIPWGQTHGRTHARTNIYSIFRDKLSLSDGRLYLYKFCELPNFYFRSLLNPYSVSLALISPMWHCITLTHFPKFRYLDKKMYLGRWLFSLPSLPLAVPPCLNSS
jgi:hypothetical protein